MAGRDIYFASNDPWKTGMPDAVKVGDTVYVKGMTGFNADLSVPPDMETQMRNTYATIGRALAHFGATLKDVVEQTVFVTDIPAALAVRHVRKEAYGDILPVGATVGVTELGAPGLMIEIKVTARIGSALQDS